MVPAPLCAHRTAGEVNSNKTAHVFAARRLVHIRVDVIVSPPKVTRDGNIRALSPEWRQAYHRFRTDCYDPFRWRRMGGVPLLLPCGRVPDSRNRTGSRVIDAIHRTSPGGQVVT